MRFSEFKSFCYSSRLILFFDEFRFNCELFFDGMREKQDPHRFLAIQGALDMIECGEVTSPAAARRARGGVGGVSVIHRVFLLL